MRQMAMHSIWLDEPFAGRVAAVRSREGRGRTLWKYGWPLLFVVAMTVLSVCCTNLGGTKFAVSTETHVAVSSPAVK